MKVATKGTRKPMESQYEPLASALRAALETSCFTLEEVAARTKVPQSTLQALAGESINAVLPARVYLRGHLGLAAKEIKMDVQEAVRLFDETYPPDEERRASPQNNRFTPRMLAVSAGLAGISILAIILAFTR